MAVVFEGKKIAKEIEQNLKERVSVLREEGVTPKLASILVGDDSASKLYVGLKKRKAENIGAEVEIIKLDESTRLEEIVGVIDKLNADESVHGIMVQLPLPEKFSDSKRDKIIEAISSERDVDGMKEVSEYITPVVKAVLIALRESGDVVSVEVDTKALVVGAEGFVGSRIFKVLEEMGYNVSGVDLKQEGDIKEKVKKADILIAATGTPGLIKKDMVKPGAVIIDVGAPKGDVEEKVEEVASFITPVPGGIGPLTVACLLENLVNAAEEQTVS